MRKKVLYIQPLHPAGMELLRGRYDVVVADRQDRGSLLEAIADASAVVTRLTTVDAELIAAGQRLEAIAKHGVGVDNIDLEAANARGIAVLTTGRANSLSVAEHTLLAMGALCKRIASLDRAMRAGNWLDRDEPGSVDLFGRRLGIVGFGRIGSELAAMARYGFHMDVELYDPHISREAVERAGYRYHTSLDTLCVEADILSLHVPLNQETRQLIDRRRLGLMKPTAYLINFARGGVVDEAALYQALVEKRLAGAALDCFEQEPPDPKNPLFQLDNVLLSPHCGTFTEDSRIRMSHQLAEGINAILSGRRAEYVANAQAIYGSCDE